MLSSGPFFCAGAPIGGPRLGPGLACGHVILRGPLGTLPHPLRAPFRGYAHTQSRPRPPWVTAPRIAAPQRRNPEPIKQPELRLLGHRAGRWRPRRPNWRSSEF